MKKSMMLEFPVSEYESRLDRLINEMDKNQLDAIVLTSDENTYYFSGFQSIVWISKVSTPGVLVITKDGEMTISSSKGGTGTVSATSCVEDIRYYEKEGKYSSYAKSIAGILKERGIIGGRIGFELGAGQKMHLNHTDREELFSELKDSEIVDAADVIWNVRCIKSPLEIERIRKCCEINIVAIEKGYNSLIEGMSELDLYRNIAQEYFRLGAEHTLQLGVRAGMDRIPHSNCMPSERPIMKGDVILVDGGPVYKGYYSDIIRQGVIGGATDEQYDMFNYAREACYIGINKIRPGEPICKATVAVDEYLKNCKYGDSYIHGGWCGHSIGCGVHEYPMLDLSEEIFEPGMVFSIEPNLTNPHIGNMGIEENILITEDGCEILTPSNSELIIIQEGIKR
jgi:Xaa-Pro aminopeptidase